MERKPVDVEEIVADRYKIESPLRRAVQEAVRIRKHAGNPIAVWRNGQVVWLGPEEIPVSTEKTP